MEESKELQSLYKLFRFLIYISLIVEIAAYAFTPDQVDTVGKILFDIWSRVKRWTVYTDGHIIYSKLMTFMIVVITCVGTRNKKQLEFDMRTMVLYPFVGGILLLVCAVTAYYCIMPPYLWVWSTNIWIYIVLSIIGTVLIHVALDNISKYLKEGLMKDRFNFENESFEQCTELVETDYSVNIPMKFYYKKKFRDGYVNISNPFRGTWVVGTPGSGKTFSVIEPFIRQHSKKGFSMVVYDYKFPTLCDKLYYHYKKNEGTPLPNGKPRPNFKFNVINFVDVEMSNRVNPIQLKYIGNLAAASETAETLLDSLQKGKKEGGGGSDQFFQTSAVNFLAACIYFFCNYQKKPYDAEGHELRCDMQTDPETGQLKASGIVRDDMGNPIQPAYWLGKYSDMPHILSFLNLDYKTIFEVLKTDSEVAPLLGPFQSALDSGAMEHSFIFRKTYTTKSKQGS